ncbi:uncharacterized protein M6B38_100285 [Iris pallida]|uniref:Ribosome biogenesis protein NOP53 n=1 Tax=Iris pallida TaxID=29817 RepID=A0AAX6IL39_IRIPA|nr:uncharacterized protein M6B38_100285 [Iris pallida]
MGKAAKGSRKGKKAWRANISTEDIDDYFQKATNDALAGAVAVASAPSDELFFVDKSTDIPVKRKIEKHRERVLHHESLLQRNAFVQPVPSSILKKCKKSKNKKDMQKSKAESSKTDIKNTPKDEDQDPAVVEIWNDKGEDCVKPKKKLNSLIPAVEVEPPGCSFNPPFEAHQDSLAQAVADEMQKVLRKELGPEPVPLTVTGEIVDEEDKYFLEVDDGNESDLGADIGDATDEQLEERQPKRKRVTRVEQNRRTRRKAQLKAEAEAKKLENLSKEIDSLPDILKEIAKEDEEKNRRHLRRIVTKQERRKSGPPRLGKHKFKPAPRQVLLTEEISGSLRKLKGCPTLARDRYKSLEKRGLLVPKAR